MGDANVALRIPGEVPIRYLPYDAVSMETEGRERPTVLYVRVSAEKQAEYLQDQRRRLEAYARERGIQQLKIQWTSMLFSGKTYLG